MGAIRLKASRLRVPLSLGIVFHLLSEVHDYAWPGFVLLRKVVWEIAADTASSAWGNRPSSPGRQGALEVLAFNRLPRGAARFAYPTRRVFSVEQERTHDMRHPISEFSWILSCARIVARAPHVPLIAHAPIPSNRDWG